MFKDHFYTQIKEIKKCWRECCPNLPVSYANRLQGILIKRLFSLQAKAYKRNLTGVSREINRTVNWMENKDGH